MGIFRIIGQVIIVLGIAVLGLGVWLWQAGHHLAMAAGQLWFNIDSASLNTTQAFVQRYLHPGVWDVAFVPLLLRPAWQALTILVFGCLILGGLLLLVPRRRGRRRSKR